MSSKRQVRKARPGVAGLIREIRRWCEANNIPVSQLAMETNYASAHRLLSEDPPVYVHKDTEERLRQWLHNQRHPEESKPVAPEDRLMLEVEILECDDELALIYAVTQCCDYFAELTKEEKVRALRLCISRIANAE